MNPVEWKWYQEVFYPRVPTPSIHKKALKMKLPKYTFFKGCLLVFRKAVPPGEVWMWRLEPDLELRQFELSDPELPIRHRFKLSDTSYPDVSVSHKRLEAI